MGLLESGKVTIDESVAAAAAAREAQSQGVEGSSSTSIGDAAAFGKEDNNEAKAQALLGCPCIAELRDGPCGSEFSNAFLCYLKSTAEYQGSDCVDPFVNLQECISKHPKAFTKDVTKKKKEKLASSYNIVPPSWSRESKKSET